jgi:hypothetical protein
VTWLAACISVVGLTCLALLLPLSSQGQTPTSEPSNPQQAFEYLYEVAVSPRCVNCHGDVTRAGHHVPLVGDDMRPHPMNISCVHNPRHPLVERERCAEAGDVAPGLSCTSCHGRTNRDERGAPPGAYAEALKPPLPWMMPTRRLVILKRFPRAATSESKVELCKQWRAGILLLAEVTQSAYDQDIPGSRTKVGNTFIHHMHEDALIAWAFTPDEGRSRAPGSFEKFAKAATLWGEWLKTGRECTDFAGGER